MPAFERLPGGRLRLQVRMPEYWMPGPFELCAMDYFDWEHFGHRHSDILEHAKLLRRGPGWFEMQMEQTAFGVVPLPTLKMRGTCEPGLLTTEILDGPFAGSNVRCDCRTEGDRTYVRETHTMQVPDRWYARFALRMPLALLAVKGFLLWRARAVRVQDFHAFEHMVKNLRDDRSLINNVLLRFPPGGAAARVARVSAEAITKGCADCGRHELGFRHRDVVRCAICDYRALHSGEAHEVVVEGAEMFCRPCVDGGRPGLEPAARAA